MSDAAVTFAILGVIVALFISNRIPVGLVAIGAALALWATGVLDLNEALSGFGDPTVLFIAGLFVVSEGLDATGVTAWAGQQLVSHAGESKRRLLVLMMIMVALLTMVISVNGAVAALLPVVVVTAVRLKLQPSELLMPLVFAAHAGSLLALTGTPVHPLVSEAAISAGEAGFGYFEYALAGLPLFLGAIAVVVFFGDRLIPRRRSKAIPPNLSKHARTLVEQYGLAEGTHHLRIRESSPLVGTPRIELDLAQWPGTELVAVQTESGLPPAERLLVADDLLIIRGDAEEIAAFATAMDLAPRLEEETDTARTLFTRVAGLAEVIIPPRSPLIGEPAFPGQVTESGDLVVLAVRRQDEDTAPGITTLAAGDTLLLQGTWDALDENLAGPEVLVVDSPEAVRRQAVPLGAGAKRALIILGGMVLALATGWVPPAVASLVAAGAMVLTRVLTPEGAYRGISWTTVVLVAGMMPMSTAMTKTGAAGLVADRLVALAGPAGPYALLAGLFVLTVLLGQLISNMATALIVIPIAIAAAGDLGLSVRPVMMSLTVAAAAAYLTPVATPVNMMVMGPAGYRFGDYWKLGLPLVAISFVISVFWVPLIWPF
ncbi:MAG: SLC13 family permease [Coriobacteriia bacterium]|jgi:di/tricarboxylate transporter|nr:SLC13 family permease [Coriobacteriia bacterium]